MLNLTRELLNQGFLLVKLELSLRKFYSRHHDLVDGWPLCNICVTNDHGYFPLVVNTRLTLWVPLVEQELLKLPEHTSSPPVFSGVRVTRSVVLCVCFVDRYLSFCTFFWPLCCLFFFDLRILITSLVSSHSSYHIRVLVCGCTISVSNFSGVSWLWSYGSWIYNYLCN